MKKTRRVAREPWFFRSKTSYCPCCIGGGETGCGAGMGGITGGPCSGGGERRCGAGIGGITGAPCSGGGERRCGAGMGGITGGPCSGGGEKAGGNTAAALSTTSGEYENAVTSAMTNNIIVKRFIFLPAFRLKKIGTSVHSITEALRLSILHAGEQASGYPAALIDSFIISLIVRNSASFRSSVPCLLSPSRTARTLCRCVLSPIVSA